MSLWQPEECSTQNSLQEIICVGKSSYLRASNCHNLRIFQNILSKHTLPRLLPANAWTWFRYLSYDTYSCLICDSFNGTSLSWGSDHPGQYFVRAALQAEALSIFPFLLSLHLGLRVHFSLGSIFPLLLHFSLCSPV